MPDAGSPLSGLPARYRVLDRVGRGAFGEVYRVEDRELGREVALKLIRAGAEEEFESARERFEREARVLAAHPHPAVVPILDVELDGAEPYLVLRWMGGGDLAGLLRREGALEALEVARIGERLTQALAHLHSHEVLHRDVKLANVLLDEDGEAYLADLGLAHGAEHDKLTETGLLVGTPKYMAPELFAGQDYTPLTDLYSLGVVLVELAAGRALDGTLAVLPRKLQEALRGIEHPELRRVLRAAVRSDPEDRLAGAAELAAELRRLLDAEASVGPTGSPADETSTLELSDSPPRVASPPAGTSGTSGPPGSPWTPVAALLGLGLLLAFLGRGAEPVPGADPPQPSSVRSPLEEARTALEQAAARLERPYQYDERELDAETDRPEVLIDDAASIADPLVGLAWGRYLKALDRFLDHLPRRASPLTEGLPLGDLVIEPMTRTLMRLRQIDGRMARMVLRGNSGAFQLGPSVELAKSRLTELREAFDRWYAERSGDEARTDLATLVIRGRVRDIEKKRGHAARIRAVLAGLRSAPEHPLRGQALGLISTLLLRELDADLLGLGEFTCEQIRDLIAEQDRLLIGESTSARLLFLKAVLRNSWRCSGDTPGPLTALCLRLFEEVRPEMETDRGRLWLRNIRRDLTEFRMSHQEPPGAEPALEVLRGFP